MFLTVWLVCGVWECQVTQVRRQQEDARKRLAEAFAAMSAYIQRYRCQESEFDLGAALMNPMADCKCWTRARTLGPTKRGGRDAAFCAFAAVHVCVGLVFDVVFVFGDRGGVMNEVGPETIQISIFCFFLRSSLVLQIPGL